MIKVALSGGIASGKTTVSDALAEYGVPIVDTDVIAREVVASGTPGLAKIAERFGDSVIDESGALERHKLREIIFSDASARKDLESILHPLIRTETVRQLQEHQSAGAPYSVVVIPLLVETDQQKNYDHVIIVDVDPAIQLQRVMARDNSSKKQAESIIASQATRSQRLAVADDVIQNNSSHETVISQVRKVHEKLFKLATNQ